MTSAIIYAFASAGFLGAGVVLAQLGLRTVEPLSGAAISVPSFTLLFLLLSPLILQGEPIVWAGLPIFIAIGLFFPASLTLLTFASNRALGPVITSTVRAETSTCQTAAAWSRRSPRGGAYSLRQMAVARPRGRATTAAISSAA